MKCFKTINSKASFSVTGLLAFVSLSTVAQANPQQSAKAPLPGSINPVVAKSMPAFMPPALVSPMDSIEVAISLKPKDMAGLQAMADAVSNPNSPLYRQYLSPEEIGQRYGAEQRDVDAVKAFFITGGMKVTHVGKTNLTIAATGTQAQIEALFGTKINYLQTTDEEGTIRYRANVTALNVPSNLVNKIQSIDGVENYTRPKRRGTTLNPTQTRTLYNVAPAYATGYQGQGRGVGISNWDGFKLTNAPLFINAYGLPVPGGGAGSNITVVKVGTGSQNNTAQGEGDLDFQMVLGLTPLANIYIFDGTGGNLVTVLSTEVSDNRADIISESYGWNVTSATATSAHTQHVAMTTAGITYMAASGDSGTSFGAFDYPDYDPEVLLVGGTVATTNGGGTRTGEQTWGLVGGWGAGGGWCTSANSTGTTFNVMPSWMVGTGVPLSSTVNRRLVPDVSLHASGADGATLGAYFIYYNGALNAFLGTSAASPTFAAGLAQVEQRLYATGGRGANTNKGRLGRIQDRVYAQNGRSDVWFDITTGTSIGNLPSSGGGALNNTAANPTAKWDFATGWGAIDFNAFYKTFFEGR